MKHVGEVKFTAKQKLQKNRKRLSELQASKAINVSDTDREVSWIVASSTITQTHDLAKIQPWIFAKSPLTVRNIIQSKDTSLNQYKGGTIVGHIAEILKADHASMVLIDEFQICAERHSKFGMPVLRRQHGEVRYVLVRAQVSIYLKNPCSHMLLYFIRKSCFLLMYNMIAIMPGVQTLDFTNLFKKEQRLI